jgi:hypothetical protein
LPPDGLGGLPPEVVASPARVSVLGLPRPVKGSLRRALPALDRARQPEGRGVGRSDPVSLVPAERLVDHKYVSKVISSIYAV